jgi:hypothetical protein
VRGCSGEELGIHRGVSVTGLDAAIHSSGPDGMQHDAAAYDECLALGARRREWIKGPARPQKTNRLHLPS